MYYDFILCYSLGKRVYFDITFHNLCAGLGFNAAIVVKIDKSQNHQNKRFVTQ